LAQSIADLLPSAYHQDSSTIEEKMKLQNELAAEDSSTWIATPNGKSKKFFKSKTQKK
jgi:hypothetical protein